LIASNPGTLICLKAASSDLALRHGVIDSSSFLTFRKTKVLGDFLQLLGLPGVDTAEAAWKRHVTHRAPSVIGPCAEFRPVPCRNQLNILSVDGRRLQTSNKFLSRRFKRAA
jgi:hypothetical protein